MTVMEWSTLDRKLEGTVAFLTYAGKADVRWNVFGPSGCLNNIQRMELSRQSDLLGVICLNELLHEKYPGHVSALPNSSAISQLASSCISLPAHFCTGCMQ